MATNAAVLDTLVPITQFNRGQASRIFDRLTKEPELIVLKNNQPSAVILAPDEYKRLSDIEEDYYLLLESVERLLHTDGTVSTQNEVMARLGITQKDLDAVPDVVVE